MSGDYETPLDLPVATIHLPSSEALAPMLYRLVFPTREFSRLPPVVQRAYVRDANRLIRMLRGEE